MYPGTEQLDLFPGSKEYEERNLKKKEALTFIRAVMGPPVRVITGTEKAIVVQQYLRYIKPYKETNNQRSATSYYNHEGTEYRVHYFDDEVTLEEVLNE